MQNKSPSFEEALARLEEISDAIESGEIGLEESIARYEEGMKLLKHCRKILAKVEQRITELQPDSKGASEEA
jgi:exodeoxyribonuclease VII small subunit